MVVLQVLGQKSLAKGVTGVVSATFILLMLILALILIRMAFIQQIEYTDIARESIFEEAYSYNALMSIKAYIVDEGNAVTINTTNTLPDPLTITGFALYYIGGFYDIIPSSKLNHSSFVYAKIYGPTGTIVKSWTNYTEFANSFPLTLNPGYTLQIKLDTKRELKYVRSGVSIGYISPISVVVYRSPPPTYNVTPRPVYTTIYSDYILGPQTIAISGLTYGLVRADVYSIEIVNGTYISGTIDSIREDDNDYYEVNSTAIPSPWKYRREIIITDNTGIDLVNYTVKIELNSNNFNFSKANPDGSDIRFYTEDGTQLPYWIEKWDSVNQEAIIWVKVPRIPGGSSTKIYMYYGNPNAGFDPNYYGLTKVMEPLPASDGPNYEIQYEEWIMPENKFQEIGDVLYGYFDDDWGDWYSLPFGFPYYESTYSQVWICSNGFIGTTYTDADWTSKEDELIIRGMIAPFWADLIDTGINYAIFHDPNYSDEYGTGVYIRWKTQFYPGIGEQNFAVVLYSNGLIRFDYGYIDGSSWTDDTPVIGISYGDEEHYTISSYNGVQYPSNYNSVMFWPRKAANPEPTVAVGSEEEVCTYISTVTITALPIDPSTSRLRIELVLAYDTIGWVNVSIGLLNYNTGTYDIISRTIYNSPGDLKLTFSVNADNYVNPSTGEVKLLINSTSLANHILKIDKYELRYLSTPTISIYITHSDRILIYDVLNDEWSYITVPLQFGSLNLSTPLVFDKDDLRLWVINKTHLWYYDLTLEEWVLVTNAPAPEATMGILCKIRDCLYYIAVNEYNGLLTAYMYNITSGIGWSMLESRSATIDGLYTVGISDGQGLVYVITSGGGELHVFDTCTNKWLSTTSLSPTAYPVGLAYDPDGGYLWVIGRGGGIHRYVISKGVWEPFEYPLLYYPLEPGNRLVYINGKLYHVRGDGTRELIIINVAGS